MNFTGNINQNTPTVVPQQSFIPPQLNIPSGIQAKTQAIVVHQLTAKGKEAAKRIPLAPGSCVAIFEEDPDIDQFYRREIDEYGNEVDFSTYAYTKVEDPPPPEFLTKQEFKEELNSALSEFATRLKEELFNGRTV